MRVPDGLNRVLRYRMAFANFSPWVLSPKSRPHMLGPWESSPGPGVMRAVSRTMRSNSLSLALREPPPGGWGDSPSALPAGDRWPGAGAIGLKTHEDRGSTPAVIEASLTAAERHDVHGAIRTDTLKESGFMEETIRTIDDRVIYTYHTGGAGCVVARKTPPGCRTYAKPRKGRCCG